jgi:hypothetical protein
LNYRTFRLFSDTSIAEIDDIGVHANLDLSNYLLVPKEQAGNAGGLFEMKR